MSAVSVEAPASVDGSVVDAVRTFARRELTPGKTDRDGRIPVEQLEGLRELGLFGLTLPAEYGGLGAGLPLATRAVRALAEVDRAVAVTVGLHLGLGTRALVRYGEARLKALHLPRLASGACIAAFATTEPGAGSDLSKLSTRVFAGPAGLKVTGEKSYVTNGGLAGLITITAHSPGGGGLEPGLAVLVLPTEAPGVSPQPEEHKLGLRGSSTRGFVFEDVDAQRDQLLGTPSTGKDQLEHTLCWGRTLMAAGCVGAATAALERAMDYTATRRQFGKALIDQPVVRGQLARSKVVLEAMAALVETTAAQADDTALHRWSVSAKVFCSEQGFELVDTALQLHGAIGYMEASGLPMMLRDLRVTRIFEGANDVLLTHAGALEVQKPVAVGELPAGAGVIAERVARRTARLRQGLGVRAFRRPELLHQLGIEVVWRDAVVAACRFRPDGALARTLVREALASLRAAERRLHPAVDLDEVLGSSR